MEWGLAVVMLLMRYVARRTAGPGKHPGQDGIGPRHVQHRHA
jgi:hypothetical protein